MTPTKLDRSRRSFLQGIAALAGTGGQRLERTYYQAPFTANGAPWVIRKDLGILPDDNDDPSLLRYVQLINEAAPGIDQKYLGLGQAFDYIDDAHGKGARILSLVLPFTRKASAKLGLIFERPDPIFHALTLMGSPIWIGHPNLPYNVYPGWENFARAWDTNHHSRDNMSVAFVLPWPNLVQPGQLMHVLIDQDPVADPGRNRMWVIAE